jgi:hypothetical protein
LAIRVSAKVSKSFGPIQDTDSFFAGANRRRIESGRKRLDARGLEACFPPSIRFVLSMAAGPFSPFPRYGCTESTLRSRAEEVRSSLSVCFPLLPPSTFTAGQVWLESKSFSGETLRTGGDTPENRIWGSGQPLRPSPFRPAYDASRTRSNDQQLRSAQYIELPGHATRNAVSSARPPYGLMLVPPHWLCYPGYRCTVSSEPPPMEYFPGGFVTPAFARAAFAWSLLARACPAAD